MNKKAEYSVKSIKYNFIMNVILKISMFVFPLITFPYVSRVLGPAGNGKISLATSIISYATMFASLGIPTYGIRACAQCRDDKDKLSKTVQELLIICVIGMLVSYIILIGLIFTIPKFNQEKKLIFFMSSSLVLSSIGIEWFYQGIEQYRYITIRNIGFKILAVILMFFLIHNSSDYILYGGITVIGTVGSNILNIIKSKDYISYKKLNKYEFKKHLRPSFNFFLLTVASTIYSNLDTVMLGLMTNDSEVGFYNAGVKVRSMLLGFVNALSTVLLPRVSYYIRNKMYDEFNRIVNTSMNTVFFLSIPLTAFFIVESKETIMLLAGEQYYQAVIPMIIIIPTLIVAGLNNLTGIQILGSMGLEKYTVISTSSAAVLDLVLNAIVIPKFGASGAAFSTLLAEILALIIQLYCINKFSEKEIKIKFDFVNLIKIIVSTLAGSFAAFIIKIIMAVDSDMFSFICGFVVFSFMFVLCLILTREKIAFEYGFPTIKKLIKKIVK